jgi:hypothetical protein
MRCTIVMSGVYIIAIFGVFLPWHVDHDYVWAVAASAYVCAWNFVLVPVAVMWTRTTRRTKVTPEGIRLSSVHPAYVMAIMEDRAADPARRPQFGDVRDDYDDGPE